jgi:hypothetical protein
MDEDLQMARQAKQWRSGRREQRRTHGRRQRLAARA